MFEQTLEQWGTKTTDRGEFISRAYQHLLLAVALFVAIEYYLFTSGIADKIAAKMAGNWLLVLGAYMLVSWGASRVAHTAKTKQAQYAALVGFISVKAVIFVPLLYFAEARVSGVIESAAIATVVGFVGLSAIAFQTRKDFSFLGGLLRWGFFIALGLIVAAVFGWIHLGMWFSVALIGFAGAAILYDTSKIIHHYPPDRYVGAGLELFASVMLMFWYMIRFMTQFFDQD